MKEKGMDLSIRENAEMTRNKSALIGLWILNIVLAAAYLLELIKGTRSLGSYLVVAVLGILPCIISTLVYLKQKDAGIIRYISGIGFSLLYTYVMFTTTTDLSFCYVIVVFMAFIVYVDMKHTFLLNSYAILVNVAVIIWRALTTGLTPVQITNAEVMIACLVLTSVFAVASIKKISAISQAHVDKAAEEKEQSEKLLQTTLNVASSIGENIKMATEETDRLNEAIGSTQYAMEQLTQGTSEAAQAITAQQQSTDEINGYIGEVETATESIVGEIGKAEDRLETGNAIMNKLLEQVKISETSSTLASKEMDGLKEYAGKMQEIMSLISNVADQTGLLALNASIEAARAGEAGKGFAVVASEISSLAAQTNNATGDINKIIENITASIEEMAGAMDALLESNRLQNEYVGSTAENFEKIHASTQEISGQAVQLKKTVEAVSGANKQVVESIENVSALTQEVTASASETLESCNMNLTSIAKMSDIMTTLETEAKKLQQD